MFARGLKYYFRSERTEKLTSVNELRAARANFSPLESPDQAAYRRFKNDVCNVHRPSAPLAYNVAFS